MKHWLWFTAGVGALGIVLSTGACSTGTDDPLTAPSTATLPSAPASSAPSTAAVTYRAQGLDLCARTDLAPLADLSLTVQHTDPKPPPSAPGAACLFEMRTADGHSASLRVEAATLPSTDDAGRLYRATSTTTGMRADGDVSGLGEQAEGFTKESEPGFKYSEYMIHARTANLVVKVWLAVGGNAFTAKDKLAGKVSTVLKATLAAVPEA